MREKRRPSRTAEGEDTARTTRLRCRRGLELQGGNLAGPGASPNSGARRGSPRPAYLLLTVCL